MVRPGPSRAFDGRGGGGRGGDRCDISADDAVSEDGEGPSNPSPMPRTISAQVPFGLLAVLGCQVHPTSSLCE